MCECVKNKNYIHSENKIHEIYIIILFKQQKQYASNPFKLTTEKYLPSINFICKIIIRTF